MHAATVAYQPAQQQAPLRCHLPPAASLLSTPCSDLCLSKLTPCHCLRVCPLASITKHKHACAPTTAWLTSPLRSKWTCAPACPPSTKRNHAHAPTPRQHGLPARSAAGGSAPARRRTCIRQAAVHTPARAAAEAHQRRHRRSWPASASPARRATAPRGPPGRQRRAPAGLAPAPSRNRARRGTADGMVCAHGLFRGEGVCAWAVSRGGCVRMGCFEGRGE
eukprot:351883-Chlamydomonas_euryale.AAC.6